MTRAATIVIPTFDHAHTLYASVASALAQTVSDIEVFVVGDGVPDITRQIVTDLQSDSRVRFFDNPKSERTGEPWRHESLKQAQGEIICYLSDDDLYLPDHVATMRNALRTADFVQAPPLIVEGEDFSVCATDLSDPLTRDLVAMFDFWRFGLSFVAHTLAFYRRLPFGWRTAPAGTPTDQYMWQQCLTVPGMKAASTFRPTVMRFPATPRAIRTTAERLDEMRQWQQRLGDPGFMGEFHDRFIAAVCASASRELAGMGSAVVGLESGTNTASDQLRIWRYLHPRRLESTGEGQAESECERLRSELAAIHGTMTWKLRQKLLRLMGRR